MKLFATIGAIVLLSLAIAGCGDGGDGNGGGGDEAAIRGLVLDFFAALQDGDAGRLASLVSEDCGDLELRARISVETFSALGDDVEIELIGVEVRNLEDDSADVRPQGTISIAGEEEPLAETEEDFEPVVKEDGEWRFAGCDFL